MGGLYLAQPLLSLAAAQPAHQSDLLLLRLVGLKSLGERKRQVGRECQWGEWGSLRAIECELGGYCLSEGCM